ncbi:Hypothetical_protein [Hexamita inflata]|uniref:Hypothetical_protein n=1 Tax=Hexamita inflata TaxID=28002 RepID=A0AA86RCA1_9EUKA|nr:Hypothetical protein HINF_LOCUS58117 [Hexamita inflata]
MLLFIITNCTDAAEKLDHCFSCIFKRRQSGELSIKVSKWCSTSNEATVQVFYNTEQIVNTTFDNETDTIILSVQYNNNITILIERDGTLYKFQQPFSNSYDKKQQKILRIISVIVIMLVTSILLGLFIVKKFKSKTININSIIIVTPMNSEISSTNILNQ